MHGHHHHHHHGKEHCHADEKMQHDHKESFSQRALDWDANPEHVSASQSAFEAISQRISLTPSTVVLEIGCGTGLLSTRIAPHVESLLGVDTAPGMVGMFKTKIGPLSEGKFPNINAKEVLLENPDDPALEGKKFDLAVSHLTLHHIPDMLSFAAVVKGTLKKGGRIAFTDFEDDGANAVRFHNPEIVVSHGVHRHGIDPNEIQQILEKVGFIDIKVEKAWTMKKNLSHEGGKAADFSFLIITAVNA
ncbi:S-adenosyl-L-methionine-dependent methyltransferase [Chytridium lagenaria]|nr:S-adenosyl-L-methionine-dependent methyltransferase [Chytridium lagenaria]